MDLIKVFSDDGLEFEPENLNKLAVFNRLFRKINARVNLVSFESEEEFKVKHILDSALILKYFKWEKGQKGLDLGTGGGLPGLVLAILRPEVHFTLVDSVEKKVKAVQEMIQKLDLKNVAVFAGRAEELAQDELWREKFDFGVARAVASLNVLLEYLAGFVRVNGNIVVYKGKKSEKELMEAKRAQEVLGLLLGRKIEYSLPENMGKRVLIEFVKAESLSAKYPRAVGKPKKRPL